MRQPDPRGQRPGLLTSSTRLMLLTLPALTLPALTLAALTLAALTLTACEDEPSVIPFKVSASDCLDEIIGGDLLCLRDPLLAIQSGPSPNACLIIERVGGDLTTPADIAYLPVAYTADGIDLATSGEISVKSDSPINLALFIFTTSATESCRINGGLTTDTACRTINGCMARLQRIGVRVSAGDEITFRQPPTETCNIERGPGLDVPESCDGTDEDCDGRVDEAANGRGTIEEPCQGPIDIGECARPGFRVCTDGQLGECRGLHEPTPDICIPDPAQRVDNDCDGDAEENLNNCGGCDDAGEQCNAIDDDCDGRVDEGLADCEAMCEPRAEDCNGRDEDCDNRADEDFDLTVPERCGRCDNDCFAGSIPGSTLFRCDAARCVFDGCNGGYRDRDDDLANGCECGPVTDEVPYDGIDQDCDGTDYVNDGYYISATQGADAGDGTPGRPFRSLTAAIDAFRDGDLDSVTLLLDRGTYALDDTLDVPDGVSIVGGMTYRPGNPPRWDPPAAPRPEATTIIGPAIVLRYRGLTQDAVLRDVTVVVDPGVEAAGNTAAVVAEQVGTHLHLVHTALIGGPAATGMLGAPGANAVRGGAAGGLGFSASAAACPGCGGAGADAIDCGVGGFSGKGGDGGTATAAEPDQRRGEDGGTPVGWDQPVPVGGAPGVEITAGGAGSNSRMGRLGTSSAPGARGGVGRAVAPYWTPALSAPGTPGQPGAGGGGGGAGGPGQQGQNGGGGGGGGSGGCPGQGGGGAGGGYGAFGLIVAEGTVILVETTITSGAGGSGGVGGAGGFGELGGPPGEGPQTGVPCGNCAQGGPGGRGGVGGCGGNAGGGAGGPSFAVLRIDPEGSRVELRPALDDAPFRDQAEAARDRLLPGLGGPGGLGGAPEMSACEPADAGPEGVAGAIGCCPVDGPCGQGATAFQCVD